MKDKMQSYFASYDEIIRNSEGNALNFNYAEAFAREFPDDIATIGGDRDPKRILYGRDIFNIPDHEEKSPLHWAAKVNNVPMICFLISQGADIEAKNKAGRTFMEIMNDSFSKMTSRVREAAVRSIEESKHASPKVIKLAECSNEEYARVINKFLTKVESELEGEELYEDGRKLIHLAALQGQKHLVDELIRRGEDVDCSTRATKITPLMYAAISGSPSTVNSILGGTKTLNARSADGNTALHAAIISGNFESAKILIAHPDLDLSIVNNEGKTVLDICKNEEIRALIGSRAASSKTKASRDKRVRFKDNEDMEQAVEILSSLKENEEIARSLLSLGDGRETSSSHKKPKLHDESLERR